MMEYNGVKSAAVSYEPVPVVDVEYIDDVYDKIMEYQQQGKFIYEKYEELPQWRHDIIRKYFFKFMESEDVLNNPAHPHFALYREKFPEYWAQAERLNKQK